jgi:dolichyl-phosphate-mannose--protein O-mannosyl transferase
MKEYMDTSKKDEFKKKALYLVLSGIFIGCAIATKWNALYVGLGLAIIFFVHLFSEYKVNVIKYLKDHVTINKVVDWFVILALIPFALYYLLFIILGKNLAGILLIVYFFVVGSFLLVKFATFISRDRYLVKLMLVSIISFIILPVVIYVLSFVLSPAINNYDGTLKGLLNINKLMYDYHSNLSATHPFSSPWYKWPIMAKPVWLYTGTTSYGLHMTISDIGNPVIWWTGVISFVYLVIS